MTDEQIAKDFSENPNSGRCSRDLEIGCAYGLEKCRELEREKAMRFAEFLSKCDTDHCYRSPKIYGIRSEDTTFIYWHTAEELYTSKAFEYYLNGLKK